MPNPSSSDVHVNSPLTNISIAFMQSADTFIASKVFPKVPVSKRSDIYFTYRDGDWNRDEARPRAPGSESAGAGYNIDKATYFCDVFALHRDLDEQILANVDNPINLEREATQFLTHKILIQREVKFASRYLAASVWSDEQTGVAAAPGANQFLQWNDALSDPIKDIREAMTRQQLLTGFRPNTLVLGQEVMDKLIDHPDLIDRVKYGTKNDLATVDASELRALFKIERVLVMGAVVNTDPEKVVPTKNNAFIGGKVALLAYVAPSPGLLTPSAGYDFSWSGLLGSQASGSRIKRFEMPSLSATRIEIEAAYDYKVISADMATIFLNAVA